METDPVKKDALERADKLIRLLDDVRASDLTPEIKERRVADIEAQIAALRKISGPRHHTQKL